MFKYGRKPKQGNVDLDSLPLKVVQDLGMKLQGKRYSRFCVFECPLCSKPFEKLMESVKTGNTSSCGCKLSYHGLTQHPLYSRWAGMLQRCYNPSSSAYYLYGGKGVTVCPEWHKFENFYNWALDKDWLNNTMDKDLKCEELNISPKLYSPETVIFMSRGENCSISNKPRSSNENTECK